MTELREFQAMLDELFGPIVYGRICGNCSACCHEFAVAEVDSKDNDDCQHMARPGCAIYANRPEACRTYACLWLLGMGEKQDRPDKINVIADFYAGTTRVGWWRITQHNEDDNIPRWIKNLASEAAEQGVIVEWRRMWIPLVEHRSILAIPKRACIAYRRYFDELVMVMQRDGVKGDIELLRKGWGI